MFNTPLSAREQVFGLDRGEKLGALKPLAAPFLATEYKAKCLGAIEMMGELSPVHDQRRWSLCDRDAHQRSDCWPLQSVLLVQHRYDTTQSCAAVGLPPPPSLERGCRCSCSGS